VKRSVAWLLVASGCSDPSAPPRVGELERGPGGDVALAARVHDERVAVETVERIAEAQAIPFEQALRLATFDALCATEARARNLDRPSSFEISSHLARRVLDEELERARESGAPTAAELASFVQQNRLEVARPEVVVVVHALFPVAADASSDEVATAERRARELAARWREASREVTRSAVPNYTPRPGLTLQRLPRDPTYASLESTAREVGGTGVTFEQLAPFDRSGNVVVDEPGFSLQPTFTAAAFTLVRRGDVADSVRTPFGIHVILLLDRITGRELSDDELRRSFSEAIFGMRARTVLERTLKDLRATVPIELDTAVDEALGRVVAKGPQ
jgi:hypothetical protein